MSDKKEKDIVPPSPLNNPEENTLSPKEKHFAKLNEAKIKYNAIAYTLEQGVENSDDEEDEDSEEDQSQTEKVYTEEDISKLRHVLLTERRVKLIDKMEALILGDQHKDSVKFFNTSYSNLISSVVPKQIIFASGKPLPEQFDRVLGITKAIINYDSWMYDHDDYDAIQDMLDLLSEAWKEIMAHNNEELGIDMEYTRPGMEKMLINFQKLLNDCVEPFEFNWY
jgi:hypothetical protein